MGTYNLSRLDNGTEPIIDITTTIVDNIGGTFPLYFLFILFVILMIGFKNYETPVSLIASSTIISLLAVLFSYMGWMSFSFVFVPSGLLLVGLIWKKLSG